MKVLDKRKLSQKHTDIFALHASTLAVDQSHHGKAGRPALSQIFLDDTTNFVRSKRVEVEHVLQRQDDRVGERSLAVNIF